MITALALASVCAWTDPGRDPYVGTVEQALARYSMPVSVRAELAALIRAGQPTDVATLTRDSMIGQRGSYRLTQMHFGRGRVCATMDRSAWSAAYSIDRVPVYCSSGECVAIPSICNNVSRVQLLDGPLIRRLPPASSVTMDEIAGGTGTATQTLPVDSFAARSQPLALPSASATAALGATISVGSTQTFGTVGGSLAGAPVLSVLPLQTVAIGAEESVVLPIHEPAIWSMILAGLGIIGLRKWSTRHARH